MRWLVVSKLRESRLVSDSAGITREFLLGASVIVLCSKRIYVDHNGANLTELYAVEKFK
jgi:hypothetical protein